MDWESLSSDDLFALFHSFCHDGKIMKVAIYPSQFGIDKMKNDAIYGPPQAIFTEEDNKPKWKKLTEEEQWEKDILSNRFVPLNKRQDR